jgi:hypothetical protein
MNWVSLIILLVVLAVWILASIVAGVQEKRGQTPRRNLPKPQQRQSERAPERTPERATASLSDELQASDEQDRKVEEARKRRKAQAERDMGVEHQRQQERDQVRRRAPVQDAPLAVPPEPSRRTDRRTEAPVAKPDRVRPVPVKPVLVGRLVDAPPAPGSAAPVAAPVTSTSLVRSLGEAAQVKRAPASPVAIEIQRLLKNPKSLAAAFMLRDIFNPPIALRRKKVQ